METRIKWKEGIKWNLEFVWNFDLIEMGKELGPNERNFEFGENEMEKELGPNELGNFKMNLDQMNF